MDELIRVHSACAALGRGERRSEILHGIELSARAGECIGLCGPNGAGKSTLLRLMAGLIAPSAGRVTLEGRDLREWGGRLPRRIAFMHQQTELPFDFSVRDTVALGRYPHRGVLGAPARMDGAAVEEAMEQAGCLALAERCVRELSGGEQQRVMLARALCQQTDVLFLDEPTASMDMGFSREVLLRLQGLAQEGRMVAAALHDLRAAAAHCSRIVLLSRGRVVADGAPRAVLTPENILLAYGVEVRVFENPAGQWDYYIEA